MRRAIFLFVFAFALPPAGAQSYLGLEEALSLGMQHSRGVRIAGAAAGEAVASRDEMAARRYPALSVGAGYLQLSNNVPDFEMGPPGASVVIPAIHDRYQATLTVQQPLFTGFRLRHQLRSADLQAAAARQEVAAAEADAAFVIERAYWTFFKADEGLVVHRAAEEQVEAHLAHLTNLRERGMATDREVFAAEARLAAVRLQRIEAEHARRMALLDLEHLVGRALPEELQVDRPPGAEFAREAEVAAAATAIERRPDVRAQRERAEALAAAERAARAARLPQVHMTGNYRYARPNPFVFPPDDRFFGTWDVGFAVSMDLWNRGRATSQIAAAGARHRQATEYHAVLEERVGLEVERALLDVQRSGEAAGVAAQGVRAATEAFRVADEQFRHGSALTTHVLEAEVALREARLRQAAVLADHAIARAALRRVSGAAAPPSRVRP
jgi:outer membrane protein